MPVAKEALTFMVVAINDSFKLPVNYFLIDGLDAMARANLVTQCIERLHAVAINVLSLTFDGAAFNLAMVKILGFNFHVIISKQHFPTQLSIHLLQFF